MKPQIRQLINAALPQIKKELGIEIPDNFEWDLDTPKNLAHGDFATNIAMKLNSFVRKNPREVAGKVKAILESAAAKESEYCTLIEKVQVEGPGFINFFLNQKSRGNILKQIQEQNEQFGCSEYGKKRKVIIEYVSANPTGPLTIAHGRQGAIGETLTNVMRAAGFQVHREFYLNDAGRQIELLGKSVWVRYRQSLGENIAIPEDGYHGEYVKDLAKIAIDELRMRGWTEEKIEDNSSEAINEIVKISANQMLNDIKEDLAGINVSFDEYFKETSLYNDGSVEKILETLKSKGLIYEAEGALWFQSTKFGDDKDRVLKRKTGEYTYFAPDIAYHAHKFSRAADLLVNLWGPDHHGYIPRVKAACQALGHDPEKVRILIVQLTTLYRRGEVVRMSKRAGEYVTLKDLIDDVGADATRFFFLMRRVESHLDFDLELAKEKSQENPVYYLQYAHARICSILSNAGKKVESNVDTSLLTAGEELEILKKITDFSELIKQSAEALEPYKVVEYLRELAALFHQFYANCRVIGDDKNLSAARLLLTDCVRIVLRNGLRILGISQPSKM